MIRGKSKKILKQETHKESRKCCSASAWNVGIYRVLFPF